MTPEAPKRDNSPTAQAGEARTRSPRPSLGLYVLFHCQLMTFGEFGNLRLCGGKETKKVKMELYVSEGLLL